MILEVDNIELNFGERKILHGIYLRAETGKITGILGRNGSGKTCLLRIIFGDLKAKYKNIRKDGVYQKTNLFKTNCISYLPQHKLLPNSLKLNNAFGLFSADWPNFVGIFNSFERHDKSRVSDLSSGELRLVETYLTLHSGRDIILLDEPFSFIAPLYVEKIKTIINMMKSHCAIVITDHFHRDIVEISDRVYFLKNGYSKQIKSRMDLENEGYINSG